MSIFLYNLQALLRSERNVLNEKGQPSFTGYAKDVRFKFAIYMKHELFEISVEKQVKNVNSSVHSECNKNERKNNMSCNLCGFVGFINTFYTKMSITINLKTRITHACEQIMRNKALQRCI